MVSASINLGTESPGAPLIYKFRHLLDNTLANVTLTSQYSITRAIRLRQALRITAVKLVCESRGDDCDCDDNNPDVKRVLVKANATQRISATDPGTNYCVEDTTVFDGGGVEMGSNDEYEMGTSVLFELDAENYDYNFATIKLYVYMHESDYGGFPCFCNSDHADTFITVPSGDFLKNPHEISLPISGAQFRVEVLIEMANKPEVRFGT